jgi:hypothetical protein
MLRRGALVCSRCGVEKTLDLMMRRSGSIRGYGARCKACSVEHTRRWKTENPEKMAIYLAQQNAREEANPEIRRLKWRKRRARLVGAEGSFTDKDLAEISSHSPPAGQITPGTFSCCARHAIAKSTLSP